jgi:hypothetical protein
MLGDTYVSSVSRGRGCRLHHVGGQIVVYAGSDLAPYWVDLGLLNVLKEARERLSREHRTGLLPPERTFLLSPLCPLNARRAAERNDAVASHRYGSMLIFLDGSSGMTQDSGRGKSDFHIESPNRSCLPDAFA